MKVGIYTHLKEMQAELPAWFFEDLCMKFVPNEGSWDEEALKPLYLILDGEHQWRFASSSNAN